MGKAERLSSWQLYSRGNDLKSLRVATIAAAAIAGTGTAIATAIATATAFDLSPEPCAGHLRTSA